MAEDDKTRVSPEDLNRAAADLERSVRAEARTRHLSAAYLPEQGEVRRIVTDLLILMFPGFFGPGRVRAVSLRDDIRSVLAEVSNRLAVQVSGALRYEEHLEAGAIDFDRRCAHCDERAHRITRGFLQALPGIRSLLCLDVQAAFDGDPAAHHTDETIFCYPGVRAIAVHRLAHELHRRDVPLIPRMMNELAHSETGIDIHPGARIGRSFFIDHGTGVVIGETTVIGDHCKLYQGVTLGARSFPKDERGRLRRGQRRHPTLEDHVTVYAGATILGAEAVIGAGSVVSGGVFVTGPVPPGSVVQAPRVEHRVRANPDMPPASYEI